MAFLRYLFANSFPAIQLLFRREILLAGVVRALKEEKFPCGCSEELPNLPLDTRHYAQRSSNNCFAFSFQELKKSPDLLCLEFHCFS